MFRLLGPLALAAGDDEVAPATRKQRQMLAVLLLEANRPVSLERLTEELWGDTPPRSAVANLRSYALALRADLQRAGLPAERLATVRNGYLLRVEPGERDLDQMETLAADATAAFRRRDFTTADQLFSAALGQWRGPTLDEIDAGPVLAARVQAIEERRLDVFEDLVETRLRLGDGKSMLRTLREHLAAHPLRERAHSQLMRLLYAQGDSAAALQAYQQARDILDAELGLDPGPDLTRLQQAILRREPIVDERPAAVTVPRQLPPDVPGLVGRDEALAWLRSSKAAVRAVHGQGGVGKSALVIRFAHELADEFPDGQLYVDLQGSNPRLTPLAPAEVLGRFIRALSPGFTDVPAEAAEAAGLFRSLVAGRRILIILDNAIDAAQVRPLLLGTPTCLVLVTSRRTLTSLDNTDHLMLGVLDPLAALSLLGMTGLAEDAVRVVEICGGLPLALRIVAAKLSAHQEWSMADVLVRLEDERRRLDELQSGDLAVRTSIEASYRSLDAATARAFRTAGYIRVPLLTAAALAATMGVPVSTATAYADVLVRARLIEPAGQGFQLHDLVRLFAAERAAAEDPPAALGSGIHRLCTYLLGTARRAVAMHYGHVNPLMSIFSGSEGSDLVEFDSREDAAAWLDHEWQNVMAMAQQAREFEILKPYSTQVIRAAMHYMLRRFRFGDLRSLAEVGLDLAGPDDHVLQGPALAALATLARRSGDTETARELYARSIDAWERSGDASGLSSALNGLALTDFSSGRLDDAMRRYSASLEVMRNSGDSRMAVFVLANIGEVLAEQGRHHEAIRTLRDALRLAQPNPAVGLRTVVFEGLARNLVQIGDARSALRLYGRVIDEAAPVDIQARGDALLGRSRTYLGLGRADLAAIDAGQVVAEAAAAGDTYRHAAGLRLLAQSDRGNASSRDRLHKAELLFQRLDRPFDRAMEKFLVGGDSTLPRPHR
ncbi:MAG: tetratricopeptide repeat protein [Hamadaea sp.]|nr:tetratricopeptide repeat protein [Hamadaea sp.]